MQVTIKMNPYACSSSKEFYFFLLVYLYDLYSNISYHTDSRQHTEIKSKKNYKMFYYTKTTIIVFKSHYRIQNSEKPLKEVSIKVGGRNRHKQLGNLPPSGCFISVDSYRKFATLEIMHLFPLLFLVVSFIKE